MPNEDYQGRLVWIGVGWNIIELSEAFKLSRVKKMRFMGPFLVFCAILKRFFQ